MKDRVILHSDINNCFASIECLHRPAIRNKPVAVCGDPESRRGIVLAKNYIAKAAGIKTGEVIWQAKQKRPDLVVVPPNYLLYLRFSKLARSIYSDYTNQIEPFGLDEAWLDVTGNCRNGIDGTIIANKIRERIKNELGVTVSVGVSFNKIFAKLGSDMKKPDATTTISRENFKETVWVLPSSDLLYVGPSTKRKLALIGVYTIGDIANLEASFIRSYLGKWGSVLHDFANGDDASPVLTADAESAIKSIGNGTTTPRDLVNDDDVLCILYVLCESIAMRMREHNFKCKTIQIYVRDNELHSFERQAKLSRATNLASDLSQAAMKLFKASYAWSNPIRSVGVRACDLVSADTNIQLSLLVDENEIIKHEDFEYTIDAIRHRFGNQILKRALLISDRSLGNINPKDDHIIHPVSYFKGGPLP